MRHREVEGCGDKLASVSSCNCGIDRPGEDEEKKLGSEQGHDEALAITVEPSRHPC